MTLRTKDEPPLRPLPVTGPVEPGSAQSLLDQAAERSAAEQAPEPPAKEKWRANYVPAPAMFNLNACCRLINDALGHYGCYLVGSSLRKRDYRDVDVRFIMDDEAFDRMFPGATPGPYLMHPLWALVCTSVSTWLRQQTGLPVDFQIQRMTQANEQFGRKTGNERHPLGMFLQLCANPADQEQP
jgi:hypothetical protein